MKPSIEKLLRRKPRKKLSEWFFWAILLTALLFLGLVIEHCYLAPWDRAQKAEAHELTDKDYCLMITQGTKVEGASFEEVQDYCARFNISI